MDTFLTIIFILLFLSPIFIFVAVFAYYHVRNKKRRANAVDMFKNIGADDVTCIGDFYYSRKTNKWYVMGYNGLLDFAIIRKTRIEKVSSGSGKNKSYRYNAIIEINNLSTPLVKVDCGSNKERAEKVATVALMLKEEAIRESVNKVQAAAANILEKNDEKEKMWAEKNGLMNTKEYRDFVFDIEQMKWYKKQDKVIFSAEETVDAKIKGPRDKKTVYIETTNINYPIVSIYCGASEETAEKIRVTVGIIAAGKKKSKKTNDIETK